MFIQRVLIGGRGSSFCVWQRSFLMAYSYHPSPSTAVPALLLQMQPEYNWQPEMPKELCTNGRVYHKYHCLFRVSATTSWSSSTQFLCWCKLATWVSLAFKHWRLDVPSNSKVQTRGGREKSCSRKWSTRWKWSRWHDPHMPKVAWHCWSCNVFWDATITTTKNEGNWTGSSPVHHPYCSPSVTVKGNWKPTFA